MNRRNSNNICIGLLTVTISFHYKSSLNDIPSSISLGKNSNGEHPNKTAS